MQRSLGLEGGHHAGPLFIAAKRRSPGYRWNGARRRRMLLRRMPAWADWDVLRHYRRLLRIYYRATGFVFSEDHIVPLHHPLVCGFHCEANIQFIPLEDNLAKGNRWWPDMPEVQLELPLC